MQKSQKADLITVIQEHCSHSDFKSRNNLQFAIVGLSNEKEAKQNVATYTNTLVMQADGCPEQGSVPWPSASQSYVLIVCILFRGNKMR